MHRQIMRNDPGEMLLGLIPRILLSLRLCPLLKVHEILNLFLNNAFSHTALSLWD